MILEIATWINNATAYKLGTTLQCGFRPESAPDRCVALLPRVPGQADFYLRDRIDFRLQVLTRATSYELAYDDAWAIHTLINGACAIDLPVVRSGFAFHLATAETVNGPASIGMDDRGRHEYTANYLLRIQNK